LSVEQRDLAENFPRPHDIQDRIAAVRRGNAHLHRTGNNRVQAVAGVAFGEQRSAPLQCGVLGVTAKLLESLWLEVGKNRVLAQHRQFAARESVSFARPLLSHLGQTPENAAGGCSPSVINAGPLFNRKAPKRADLAAGR